MIQLAMLFALGALAASLVALALLPIVFRRAEGRAAARLERRLPLSLPEIAAERDALRAAHAVEIRQIEQRVDALHSRVASLLGETGRQSTRLVTLEQRRQVDAEAIAGLEAASQASGALLRDREAEMACQAVVLHDAYVVAERRRDLVDAATARLANAETLLADQRTVIADLEKALALRAVRPSSETERAVRLSDDMVQMRAAFGRLRAEHEVMRNAHDAMASERERLRFRVDELLLRIEELQDHDEGSGETWRDDRRRLSEQDKTVKSLMTRVAAREEALGTVKLMLAEETARRKAIEAEQARLLSGRPEIVAEAEQWARDDPAALRRAVAALAADLVRVAARDEPETRRPAVSVR